MRVVIIGGGFGGLAVARGLGDAPAEVEVTLVDKRNFHLFQPLLYQVATGGLSPANIASPLRAILARQANTRVLLDEATAFDVANKRVICKDGAVDYDVLVVAPGSRYNYFGHPEWEQAAPHLKSLEDALTIRARILQAFEDAERAALNDEAPSPLTFVIIGGGPTGVELAGAIAELAAYTLKHDFRDIRSHSARILLLEAVPRVLPPYPESLSQEAEAALNRLGVEVRTSTVVTDVDDNGVWVKRDDVAERIDAATVIWAAGVLGSPLGESLAHATSVTLGRSGRIPVETDLTLPGHPEIFVVGDLASLEQDGAPLPAIAPVALQQGAYVAAAIKDRLQGKRTAAFRYSSRGNLATIGRSAAVADLGRIKLSGFIGWVTWLVVHLLNLARFENRLLVLVQWAWNYFTHGRSARLITDRFRTGDTDEPEGPRDRDSGA